MIDNFDDYPSVPIGSGNPYWCCALCGKSAPQLFRHLEAHNSWCLYRKVKEAIIADDKDLMLDLVIDLMGRNDCYSLGIELRDKLGLKEADDEDV